MKLFTSLLTLIFTLPLLAFDTVNGIPQVPASITIADVKLKITADAQREIQKDVDALRASEKYFNIKLDRVNLYFPIIEKALKEEGIPDDIKYLSVQESSLISDAVSSADAVGYWQFKDFTAREVGLRVDGKIDERKNIYAASHGAAKYFKRNNFFVKNWIYAVSAYQAGPAGVKKYVDDKFVGTDKLTIDKKTHWYAKRFIAHVIAFRDEVGKPHSEGLRLEEYANGAGKDLGDIAKEFKIDREELAKYNKWLKSGKVPNDKAYMVIIPLTGKAPKVKEDKAASEPAPLTRDTKETPTELTADKFPDNIVTDLTGSALVFKLNGIDAILSQTGDTKDKLAKRAGLSKKKFDKYNDMLPGQPVPAGTTFYLRKKKRSSSIYYHTALAGQSLWDISQLYGVQVKKLEKLNREKRSHIFKQGRLIYLKGKRPDGNPIYNQVVVREKEIETPTVVKKELETVKQQETIEEKVISNAVDLNKLETTTTKKESQNKQPEFIEDKTTYDIHIVQPGETLWGIARKYNVTVPQMLSWNGIAKGETISIGQNLQIGAPVEVFVEDKTPPEEEEEIIVIEEPTVSNSDPSNNKTHVVGAGETLYSISKKYNLSVSELLQINGLTSSSTLAIGQELTIIEEVKETKVQEPVAEVKKETVSPESKVHIVQAGETLYSIARKYNIPTGDLLAMNNLNPKSTLSIGQELKLKENPTEVEKPMVEKTNSDVKTHQVTASETLYGIATKYGISVKELLSWNDFTPNTPIQPGQIIQVSDPDLPKKPSEKEEAVEEKTTTKKEQMPKEEFKIHIVRGGDTLYDIATKYGMKVKELKDLNNKKDNALKVGEELKVKNQ